jgi:hypothetical protein
MTTTSTARGRAFAALVVLFTLCGLARADQLASNINGTDIGVWGINESFWSGVPFTTDNQAWFVDSTVAPVSQGDDRSTSGIFMQVYSNNAGQPGLPLGTKLVTPTITSTIENQTFTRIGAAALLAPNTTYWMVLGVDDPFSDANPVYRRTTLTPGSGPGSMGLSLWSSQNDGASWSFQSPNNQFQNLLMQINGTVVPEPSTLAVVVGGCALLATRRARRSRPDSLV